MDRERLKEVFQDTLKLSDENEILQKKTAEMCYRTQLYFRNFINLKPERKSDILDIEIIEDTTYHCASKYVSDNKIAVFNKNGKMISEFSFNGIISDIQISHNHIYCMSDTNVFIYSRSGELLRTDECDFGAVKFAVISAYSIAVIKNDEVSRLEIKK